MLLYIKMLEPDFINVGLANYKDVVIPKKGI